MTDDIFDQLVKPEEGYRLKVYDDKDGEEILPGDTCEGHPTIGIGRALDTRGLTDDEVQYLYRNDKTSVISSVLVALPWAGTLDNRKYVLYAMAFQMGVAGLLKFERMLAAAQAGNWQIVHDEMLASAWAKQTPARAQRMAAIMLSGNI